MAGISNTIRGYFLPRSISAIALQAVCLDGQYLEFASIKELRNLWSFLSASKNCRHICSGANRRRKVNTSVYTEENNNSLVSKLILIFHEFLLNLPTYPISITSVFID